MCGIVGYVGRQPAAPLLLAGLRRLEYRGYDSAGLATWHDGQIELRKCRGKIDEGLAPLLEARPLPGHLGVGHTRWATHGPPSDINAHPHCDASGRIAVVHNGVIENHEALKQRLRAAGHAFRSETDTEVLAHLIGVHYAHPDLPGLAPAERLVRALERALAEVQGTYGLGVIDRGAPIRGTLWLDADRDGIRQVAETAAPNVTVTVELWPAHNSARAKAVGASGPSSSMRRRMAKALQRRISTTLMGLSLAGMATPPS